MNKSIRIKENVSLAPFTTLEIGGPALFFLSAQSEEHLVEGFEFARRNALDVFVLGGGSNILVSDNGFEGLVIHIQLKGIDLAVGESVITGSAGEDWDAFVAYCVNKNMAGLECLSGIPGTAGGTPVQNVGAYGQEVSETVVSVRCFDRENNTIITLSNEQCGFAYRTSIFNTVEFDRYVVISTTYSLEKNGLPKIVYKDLIEHFRGHSPTLAETREAVLSIRRSKSMVIDPGDANRRSVGSFFKNPIVSQSKFDKIALKFDDNVPHFPALPSLVKIPAAWLIEHAGFYKGFVMGNVGLSTNHTLAIVNRGGASAADVLRLRDAIRSAVSSEFGVDLVQEPVLVGNFTAKI